ncbi:PAS domain S-box protein [Nocardioides sp.]|uniref:PAS domain S-box protein n=1 Tax=Nocardioides sp. TaxID=35761 RepID=UPI0037833F1F
MGRRGKRTDQDAFARAWGAECSLALLTDRRGRVLHFGSEAERVSGYRADEVVGKPVWTVLVAEEHRDGVAAAFSRRRPRPAPVVVDWVTKDGRRRSIAWATRVLHDGPEPGRVLLTGTDLTEERLAQGLLATVLDADSGLAFISTDTVGAITFVSPGAERMLGRASEELVGQSCTRLHDPVDLAARCDALGDAHPTEAVLGAVRHGLRRERRDWQLLRGDGTLITASVTVSPMHDGVGRMTGFLLHPQNVTDERRAQQHLEAALESEREAVNRLQVLDEVRNDFITTVSHELRTPLTNILGYTDVLLEDEVGELTAAQRKVVDRVDRNAKRLQLQVEDLLLLSQVDSGTFRPDRSPVALSDVVGTALDQLAVDVRDRVDVVVRDEESTVLGDAPRLVGVVRGLVDNALKFSHDEEPVLVEVRREGTDQVLEVTDSGMGIPRAEQQHLFQRFFRCATARTVAAQGLGLGLAVVAAVIAAHDGDVSIASDEGAGTTVVVRLPTG